jgi:hypothetical protein
LVTHDLTKLNNKNDVKAYEKTKTLEKTVKAV